MRLCAGLTILLLPIACGHEQQVGGGGTTSGTLPRTDERRAPETSGANAGIGGDPITVPSKVIFVGDFETGDLSQWTYVERCKADRILVYSKATAPAGAPPPRQGQYAARFRVLDSDVAPCTSSENPRAELETPPSLFAPGDDRWEAWSIYVPLAHPQPRCGSCENGAFFAFQEDYGAPFDGPPSLGWNLDFTSNPHRLRLDRGWQYDNDRPGSVPLTKGQWIDFLVHKKFANTISGGGFVEAWVGGSPVVFEPCDCTRLPMQTMHSSQRTVGFYLLAYRSRGLFSSFDLYVDAVRIGTSRAAVETR